MPPYAWVKDLKLMAISTFLGVIQRLGEGHQLIQEGCVVSVMSREYPIPIGRGPQRG